ncbi:hypothetical protein [Pseudomonas sp. Irchel 3E13]|uniref:hypothetical protein n=1 Tax=Pseudomonas sp. Irchel 3E13 TaxID=2008975 RepID=UPI001179B7F4|nr:hypothetical protein [Pseudomonas sp. Irchel 3E13]
MSTQSLFNDLKKAGLDVVILDQDHFAATAEDRKSAISAIASLCTAARREGYFVRCADFEPAQVEQVLGEWGGEEAVARLARPMIDNALTGQTELGVLRGQAAHLLHEGLARIRIAASADRELVESIAATLQELPNNVLGDDHRSRENLRELIGPARKLLSEARGNNKWKKGKGGVLPSPFAFLVMAAISAADAFNSSLDGKIWYASAMTGITVICIGFAVFAWKKKKP